MITDQIDIVPLRNQILTVKDEDITEEEYNRLMTTLTTVDLSKINNPLFLILLTGMLKFNIKNRFNILQLEELINNF